MTGKIISLMTSESAILIDDFFEIVHGISGVPLVFGSLIVLGFMVISQYLLTV